MGLGKLRGLGAGTGGDACVVTSDNTARMSACATILLNALVGLVLFRADASHVFFLGRPIEFVCGFRRLLGIPCPGCGFTRSVVLALHGDWRMAWGLAPAGPMALVGLLGFAAALAVPFTTKKWIVRGTLIYAALTTLVWIGFWTMKVF